MSRNHKHYALQLLLGASLGFLFTAVPARAQAGQTAEEKIDRLEQRIAELERRLSAAPKTTGAEENRNVEAPETESKIEELDQRFRVAERKRELQQEEALAKASSAPVVTADSNGFSLKSANGDSQLKISGYLQTDGRFYPGDDGGQLTDSILLRRVRPILQGTVFKYVDFRIMPDFGGGSAQLYDAYLELRYFSRAAVRAGKFKAPVGLERLQSGTDVWFVERGLPTSLVPSRDVGFQLSGDLVKNRLNYAIGVFDGSVDGALLDTDSGDGKDYVARLFATPFQSASAQHPLSGLGIGIAATKGDQTGAGVPSFKSFGQGTYFSYAAGVSAAGERTRYSPQGYYFYGPLGVLAEYVRSEQKVRRNNLVTTVSNQAWQVEAAWVLTGEPKSYRGVAPRKVFAPASHGWGAWELVFRTGELTVDPSVYAYGLADSTKAARRAREWAGGVNWYLNKAVKLTLNYANTNFSGGAASGDRPSEKAILTRFQVSF
jgi:phosphate-selective porin OprO and OprP